ncbi:hypothetical protein F4805DRAFT_416090 [Annulohypoxylon moriforme]|nr:hypothetical protein F4805DRAFT_416090 [Annulohypoxylon moriforme]
MDPLSAVGLASNIIQFISFCAGLYSESRQIYSSTKGTTREFERLEEACRNLKTLAIALTPANSPDSLETLPDSKRPIQAEIDLARLASKCKDLAEDLAKELGALRLDDASHTRLGSFWLALKSKLNRHRIYELHDKVNQYRGELMVILIAVTNMKQSSLLKHLEELKKANLNVINDHSSKLNEISELVKKTSNQAEKALASHDVLIPLDSILNGLKTISASSTRHFILEHHVVCSLYFDSLLFRHESIQDAHKKTFEWFCYRPGYATSSYPQVTIRSWLEFGSGIYWVSGKPGSGKSTFMKFVADHLETQRALDNWATSDESTESSTQDGCITASFYFWSAGTPLQKSTEGLLRSLLFEILSHVPELIPVVFPERWAYLTVTEVRERNLGKQRNRSYGDWTIKDLSAALRLLSTAPACSPKRFCFFIDGLDEYHGDHRELVNMLLTISANHNIKLCVSSRPWNVFEDNLGQDISQKLYIHEVTQNDIWMYTVSTLQEDANWTFEASTEPQYNTLVDKIIEKAHGVFLWVVLVVRSLQEGLSNGDSLLMLDQRVQDLPEELGPFFRHILLSVSSIYHVRMALYFYFTINSSPGITLMHFSFLDDCIENENYALDTPIAPMDGYEMAKRCKKAKRRLNACCRGLLEVQNGSIQRLDPGYLTPQVTFLHRTVKDFLQTDEMWCFFQDLLGETQMNTVVLSSLVAFYKNLPPPLAPPPYFSLNPHPLATPPRRRRIDFALASKALYFASGAEKEAADTAIRLVDELLYASRYSQRGFEDEMHFYERALYNGLCEYISYKLRTSSEQEISSLITLALYYANSTHWKVADMYDMLAMLLNSTIGINSEHWVSYMEIFGKTAWRETDLDMVKRRKRILSLILPHVKDMKGWGTMLDGHHKHIVNAKTSKNVAYLRAQMIGELLTYGADPNDSYMSGTCWTWLCDYIRMFYTNESPQRDIVRLEFLSNIVELFLKAGADTSCDQSLTVDQVNSIFPASLAKPLCDILQDKSPYENLDIEGEIEEETSLSPIPKYFGVLSGVFTKTFLQ